MSNLHGNSWLFIIDENHGFSLECEYSLLFMIHTKSQKYHIKHFILHLIKFSDLCVFIVYFLNWSDPFFIQKALLFFSNVKVLTCILAR